MVDKRFTATGLLKNKKAFKKMFHNSWKSAPTPDYCFQLYFYVNLIKTRMITSIMMKINNNRLDHETNEVWKKNWGSLNLKFLNPHEICLLGCVCVFTRACVLGCVQTLWAVDKLDGYTVATFSLKSILKTSGYAPRGL